MQPVTNMLCAETALTRASKSERENQITSSWRKYSARLGALSPQALPDRVGLKKRCGLKLHDLDCGGK